jgi:hypothetical protein
MKKHIAAFAFALTAAVSAFAAEEPVQPFAALAGVETQALNAEEMDAVHGSRLTLLQVLNSALNNTLLPQVVRDRIFIILTTQSGLARRLRHVGDL